MSVCTQWAPAAAAAPSSTWKPRTLLPLLIGGAATKLLLQWAVTLLSVRAGYGMFRDEFYYLVCAHRLALGYVDQPPLVALQARAAQMLGGGPHHLLLFRLLPALAGAIMVVLTGLIAHALGGGRKAAAIAMLAVLTVPVFVATQSFLSMNAWEPVFWMTCVLAALRLLSLSEGAMRAYGRQSTTGWWLLLGAGAGLGLENKASAIFFLAALVLALLVTPARRLLRTRGFWLAVAVTLLLAMPNVLWQVRNHYPTWQWLRAVQHSNKDVVLSPPRFLLAQFLMLAPVHLLVWLPGLLGLARRRAWRFSGALLLLFFLMMLAMHAKDYYVAPIYPLLFAAGGVEWARWIGASRRRLAFGAGCGSLMLAGFALTLPFTVPVLSPPTYVRYAHAVHFAPIDSEQHPASPLPEFFSDFLGWQGLADEVARVYHALPADQQAQTGIFASNYGQASALNVLGKPLGLPVAISGHQNYWLWGPHGDTGREMIVVTPEPLSAMLPIYRTCTVEAYQTSPYRMPWEQRYIYLCHDRLQNYGSSWAAVKLYR